MRTTFGFALIVLVMGSHSDVCGDVPDLAPTAANALSNEAWADLIRATVLAALPEKRVQDKRWGQTAPVFSRYEIKTKGGRSRSGPRPRRSITASGNATRSRCWLPRNLSSLNCMT